MVRGPPQKAQSTICKLKIRAVRGPWSPAPHAGKASLGFPRGRGHCGPGYQAENAVRGLQNTDWRGPRSGDRGHRGPRYPAESVVRGLPNSD